MSAYDRKRAAEELLRNPLLNDLLQEMKDDITAQIITCTPEEFPELQAKYRAIDMVETTITNLDY